MPFNQEVKSFLAQAFLTFDDENPFSFKSDFPFLFSDTHQILIHCISLQHQGISNFQPEQFSQLSDSALAKNVKIIHLWEDVWNNKKQLTQSRILALCGISKRVYARQTEVVRLNKEETDAFLQANHLQESVAAYYKYGLYHKDELVAVATFSKSRTMQDGPALYRSYELVRFANKSGSTVIGGLSKLLNFFIEQHHPAHIMTYADRDWSSGEGYKKLGFMFTDHTPPQAFFIHPSEQIRFYAHRLPENFSSETEILDAGYVKIYNAGNSKFILDRRNL